MTPAIEEVVKGLTKAQREGLCRQPCRSWWGDRPAAMPRIKATAMALWRRGLIDWPDLWGTCSAVPLTPLGLACRSYLMEKNNGK